MTSTARQDALVFGGSVPVKRDVWRQSKSRWRKSERRMFSSAPFLPLTDSSAMGVQIARKRDSGACHCHSALLGRDPALQG